MIAPLRNADATPRAQVGRGFLTDAIILATASATAYALTFTYEAGYLAHFGLPIWLVELDIARVFVAASGLLVLGTIAYWFVMIVPEKAREALPLFRMIALPVLFYAIAGFLVIEAWKTPSMKTILAAVVVFVLAFVCYRWLVELPLRPFKEEPRILKRFARAEEKWAQEQTRFVFHGIARRLYDAGYNAETVRLLAVLLYVSFHLVYFLGGREAERQEVFLLSRGSQTLVALRQYGDRLVTAELNQAEGCLTGRFALLPATGGAGYLWTLTRTGRVVPPAIAQAVSDHCAMPTAPLAVPADSAKPIAKSAPLPMTRGRQSAHDSAKPAAEVRP